MSPLGRGRTSPFWRGIGELDALEVLDDARLVYGTDRTRQTLAGVSNGGYGTARISSNYPDGFSSVFVHCPVNADNATSAREGSQEAPESQPFTVEPIIPNLLNVHFRHVSGFGDPLARATANRRIRDVALANGLDVRHTEYLNGSHCFNAPAASGGWVRNHGEEHARLLRPRVETPGRIHFTVDARQYPSRPEVIGLFDIRDVGIDYDGAYWLDGVEVRPDILATAVDPTEGTLVAGNLIGGPGEEVLAHVDVTARWRADWAHTLESCDSALPVGAAGEYDPARGNPQARSDESSVNPSGHPNPHTFRCQTQSAAVGVGTQPQLDVTLTNVERLSLDLEAIDVPLDHGDDISVMVSGDGPTDLTVRVPDDTIATGACLTRSEHDAAGLLLELALGAATCEVTLSRPALVLVPTTLDFDEDGQSAGIVRGQVIDDEYGTSACATPTDVAVTADHVGGGPDIAVAFDSEARATRDPDLEGPNGTNGSWPC